MSDFFIRIVLHNMNIFHAMKNLFCISLLNIKSNWSILILSIYLVVNFLYRFYLNNNFHNNVLTYIYFNCIFENLFSFFLFILLIILFYAKLPKYWIYFFKEIFLIFKRWCWQSIILSLSCYWLFLSILVLDIWSYKISMIFMICTPKLQHILNFNITKCKKLYFCLYNNYTKRNIFWFILLSHQNINLSYYLWYGIFFNYFTSYKKIE